MARNSGALVGQAWDTCPLPLPKTRGGRRVVFQGNQVLLQKGGERGYRRAGILDSCSVHTSCVPGIGQGPMYASHCGGLSGEIIVPVLVRTLQPERLVPCESRPAAGLALEPSVHALAPAPKPWARPKLCAGTNLIKKLDLCLKRQTPTCVQGLIPIIQLGLPQSLCTIRTELEKL